MDSGLSIFGWGYGFNYFPRIKEKPSVQTIVDNVCQMRLYNRRSRHNHCGLILLWSLAFDFKLCSSLVKVKQIFDFRKTEQ
jgi:hypothetical protein